MSIHLVQSQYTYLLLLKLFVLQLFVEMKLVVQLLQMTQRHLLQTHQHTSMQLLHHEESVIGVVQGPQSQRLEFVWLQLVSYD